MASKIKKIFTFICIVIVIGAVLILAKPFYIINEGEQVVITRLQSIVESHSESGLYFKIPVIDRVTTYPKKILSIDGDTNPIQTQENLSIIVDITARWKITDPEKFYGKFQKIDNGYNRVSDIIDSACRTIIPQNKLSEIVRSSNIINEIQNSNSSTEENADSNNYFQIETLATEDATNEVISLGRDKICNLILQEANKNTADLGLQIIDVVPRKIKYKDEITDSIYNRMIKDRNQVATRYRSEGEGKKREWLGILENEKLQIESEAYKTAEQIKGEADAEAARIYAEAYNKDPEFYTFWKSMESYKKTLKDYNATYSTNMDYFDYLYSADGKR